MGMIVLRNSRIIKFLIAYCIVKVINFKIGFSYNVFTEGFNLINLVIDLTIWIIAYSGVSLFFSKFVPDKNVIE